MNKIKVMDQINEIKKSIIYLTALKDHESLINANNDLKHYEILLSGFSIPARINTVSN